MYLAFVLQWRLPGQRICKQTNIKQCRKAIAAYLKTPLAIKVFFTWTCTEPEPPREAFAGCGS